MRFLSFAALVWGLALGPGCVQHHAGDDRGTARRPAKNAPSASADAPHAAPVDGWAAHIHALVRREALDRGVPGVAVAIVHRQRVLVARGYGVADVRTSRPVTAATPFNIASVTKPFTAALVRMLVRDGRIDLDDPARQHLPLPACYRTITVRQLLTHTSGIARDLRTDNNDDPDAATYRDRLTASTPSSPPGTQFEYSNTGYTVLGWLVAAIEGRPLADVFQERIFRPLNMNNASYRVALQDDATRARPHEVDDGTAQPTIYVSGGFGSGGLALSALDFAAFGRALQSDELLSDREKAIAWTPARLRDGRPVRVRINSAEDSYGFGWFLTTFAGRRLVTHGGGITGYSANLYHFPDQQLTIAVIANAKTRDDGVAPVDPLAREIAKFSLAKLTSSNGSAAGE